MSPQQSIYEHGTLWRRSALRKGASQESASRSSRARAVHFGFCRVADRGSPTENPSEFDQNRSAQPILTIILRLLLTDFVLGSSFAVGHGIFA